MKGKIFDAQEIKAIIAGNETKLKLYRIVYKYDKNVLKSFVKEDIFYFKDNQTFDGYLFLKGGYSPELFLEKNGWLTKSGDTVKNKTFWLKLEHLNARHQITWHFVRGHSGNRGNEIADQLAIRGKEEEKLKIKKSLVK